MKAVPLYGWEDDAICHMVRIEILRAWRAALQLLPMISFSFVHVALSGLGKLTR